MQERTSIQIEKATKERLQSHGKMGDSFDTLINRILDQMGTKEQQPDEVPWVGIPVFQEKEKDTEHPPNTSYVGYANPT